MTDPSKPPSKTDKGRVPDEGAAPGKDPDATKGAEVPPATEPDLAWDAEPAILEFAAPTPPGPPADAIPVEDPRTAAPAPKAEEVGDESPTVISKTHGRNPASEDLAASLRGRRLAHFELIAPVGVGGMAAVIKGRDLQLDRTVALKILPPEMAQDPENVRRFHQEARAAAKLDHENIARVYFCGEDQKLHFIAFEFVQGENLRHLLEHRGKLPVGEAVNYLLQVAAGLAHAAGRGVVHRDIKPSNIIITPGGRAKLVDMGLARSQSPHDDHGLTHSGVTLGTFDYISPEQALEPRDADVRSDIYSLGCTFYHMLTGQPPVPEGTAARKLHFHQHEAPLDPRELNRAVPDDVAAILARMMAKDPRERYQRPEQLVQHLLLAAGKLSDFGLGAGDLGFTEGDSSGPGGGRKLTVQPPLFLDAPLPAAPRPGGALLLAALAFAGVIALVFALQQPAGPPRPRGQESGVRSQGPGGREAGKKDQGAARQGDKTPGAGQEPGPPAPGRQAASPSEGPSRRGPFVWKGGDVRALLSYAADAPPGADLDIVLADDLVLSGPGVDLGPDGLTLRGRKVTLRGGRPERGTRDGGWRPTVWFVYNGRVAGKRVWTALDVQADEVTVEGVRVVIDARGAVPMTGLLLRGGKAHVVRDCQFVQGSPGKDEALSSVVLDSAGKPGPSLSLTGCAFVGAEEGLPGPPDDRPPARLALRKVGRGGQEAVVRRGPGRVEATDCVFGPHRSCFRLEGVSERVADDVRLSHCSALLGEGSAVFFVADAVTCRLEVSYSLFAAPRAGSRGQGPGGPEEGLGSLSSSAAVLLRQDNGAALGPARYDAVQFLGTDNRYANLDGFWLTLPADLLAALDARDFEARLQAGKGWDVGSRVLARSPWEDADPPARLGELELARAFRPRPAEPALRQTGLEGEPVGARWCDGVSYRDGLPRLPGGGPPAARAEKVVDPSARGPAAGVFPSLARAFADARDGDVILIKHNGPLPVKPVTLEKGSVTVRAAPGWRPVLTLDAPERDASLFRVLDGKVTCERLEFRLEAGQMARSGDRPRRPGTRAVATVLGEGSCAFADCVFTLAEPQGLTLACVVLDDPDAVMKGGAGPPGVAFERCFVRGQGDLVRCRASRPFRLRAEGTLAALSGSVLVVDAGKQVEQGDPPPRSEVDLRHVTACVGGSLLELRAGGAGKGLKGVVPLTWKPSDCLFVSLGDQAVVEVGGGDAGATALEDALRWQGGHNAYSFAAMVAQKPSGTGTMPPRPYGREEWKGLTGEDAKYVEAVKFAEAPDADNLAKSRPGQFAAPELKDYGAEVDLLPGKK